MAHEDTPKKQEVITDVPGVERAAGKSSLDGLVGIKIKDTSSEGTIVTVKREVVPVDMSDRIVPVDKSDRMIPMTAEQVGHAASRAIGHPSHPGTMRTTMAPTGATLKTDI